MKFPGRFSYPQAVINLVASFKAENTRLWQVLDEIIKIRAVGSPFKFVSANYNLTLTDFIIVVDCSRGDVTITLPIASSSAGEAFHIKKIDASANNVIIDPVGSSLIDKQASISFNVQYKSYQVQCDGQNWYVV